MLENWYKTILQNEISLEKGLTTSVFFLFKFFTRAMNAIMENVDVPSNVKSKLPKEVSDNLNIVFNLSKDMGVDIEYMKRYYCCMLYALDYHSEAEKVKTSLNIKKGKIFPPKFLTS